MPSDLSLHQLRIFLAVARLRSFSGAAADLGLSQPAVSLQTRSLEQALGVSLFRRRRGEHELTEAGCVVQDYAERLFTLIAEMQQVVEDINAARTGTLVLGTSTTPGEYILPTVIGRYQRRYPGVEVSLVVSNSQDIVRRIQRRELDLAVVGARLEDPELVVRPYVQDEIVVVAGRSSALAMGRRPVPFQALHGQPFVLRESGSATRLIAEAYLQSHGIHIRPVMELGSNEALKRTVATGFALGLISRHAIGPEVTAGLLVVVPVEGWSCTRPLSVIYRNDKTLTAAQRAFLALLEDGPMDPLDDGPLDQSPSAPIQ